MTRRPAPPPETVSARRARLERDAEVLRQQVLREVITEVKDAVARYGLTEQDLGFGSRRGGQRPGR